LCRPTERALTTGTRLGAYEVTGLLGAGRMGDVYRATDTNLKRAVAIKVLPESVATNRDRLARGPIPADEALPIAKQIAETPPSIGSRTSANPAVYILSDRTTEPPGCKIGRPYGRSELPAR
jgi:serine/threonine protein kinase